MNNLLIKQVAFANITIPNVATTVSTGVYIPKGAIITGVRWASGDAVTISDGSATCQLRVGAMAICSTINMSDMGAIKTPIAGTLMTAGGVAVSTVSLNNELNLICGSSVNGAITASYDVYVDYLYINTHE